MLKAIKIENYQSHKNTVLKFSEGINVLCGLSSAGKTAILRALRWVLTNRPTGFRYHSQFTDDPHTKVTLYTDKHIITHHKTTKEDKYSIKGKNRWAKVNKDVPDEVVEALNLTELNIHNQFDSPLLITSTPTEIGRVINQVTGVERADTWRSKLTTKINDLKKEQKIIGRDVNELQGRLAQFSNLDKVGKLVDKIKLIDAEVEALCKERTVINEFLEAMSKKTALVKKLAPLKEVVAKIDEIFMEFVEVAREKDAVKEHITTVNKYLDVKNQRAQVVDQYVDLLRDSGLCPTCFTKIDEDQIERIIDDLNS